MICINVRLSTIFSLPGKNSNIIKVLLLTFNCVHGLSPRYLRNCISLYTPSRMLRSNNVLKGTLSRSSYRRKKHGGRAFSNVASDLWNILPRNIREADSVSKFKSLLKTHYFIEHYGQNYHYQ